MKEALPQTVKLDDKIYALECGCAERGGYSYSMRRKDTGYSYPHKKAGCVYFGEDWKPCPKCTYIPWVIIAKE